MSGFRPARLCAAIALGAAALVSFSSAHAAEGDTPRVALVMKSLANEFFRTMEDGAKAYQKENPAPVSYTHLTLPTICSV